MKQLSLRLQAETRQAQKKGPVYSRRKESRAKNPEGQQIFDPIEKALSMIRRASGTRTPIGISRILHPYTTACFIAIEFGYDRNCEIVQLFGGYLPESSVSNNIRRMKRAELIRVYGTTPRIDGRERGRPSVNYEFTEYGETILKMLKTDKVYAMYRQWLEDNGKIPKCPGQLPLILPS